MPNVSVASARVTDSHLVVVLADGCEVATPLGWYPRLSGVPPEQRAKFEVSPFGIHWPELDEDLGFEGILAGRQATTPG